jgi:GNAT superfamily N-acetyltransferase
MNDELINKLNNKLGIEIIGFSEVENNEIFKILKSRLKWYFSRSPLRFYVKYDISEIHTIVGTDKGYICKKHDCITFSLSDGTHIRFSPDESDGIEITKLYVPAHMRRKGIGKMLLGVLTAFLLITIGEIPKLSLECTGALGLDNVGESESIENQIRFFESFGFRVTYSSKVDNYVKMEYYGDENSIKTYLE